MIAGEVEELEARAQRGADAAGAPRCHCGAAAVSRCRGVERSRARVDRYRVDAATLRPRPRRGYSEDGSRRGRDVNIPRRRVAAAETSSRAAAATTRRRPGKKQAQLKQITLQIRDKELSLFATNFSVLGTKAAFLCGLAWSGLTMVPRWQRAGDPGKFALVMFYSLDSFAICCNLFTMTLSTYAERKWALRGFWAGNGFILLACIALAWVKFETAIASAVTCVLVVFIAANTYYIYKITRPRFRMPKNAERRRPKAGDFDEMRGAAPRNTIGAGGGDGDVEVGPPPNRRTPSKRS